jgi:hypothetical protein
MPTADNNMGITHTQGYRTPCARNWLSTINQARQKRVTEITKRQTTKYARIQYTNKAGTDKIVVGNSNNTVTGDYVARNVFDKTTGLVATYSTAYSPVYMDTQIAVEGTDRASARADKEWITWKGHNQLVEIEGSVSISVSTAVARTFRLKIFVNDLIVNGDVQNQPHLTLDQYGDTTGFKSQSIRVKTRTHLDSNDTIKLMIDRTDAQDNNYSGTFFDATLTVKTLPMS